MSCSKTSLKCPAQLTSPLWSGAACLTQPFSDFPFLCLSISHVKPFQCCTHTMLSASLKHSHSMSGKQCFHLYHFIPHFSNSWFLWMSILLPGSPLVWVFWRLQMPTEQDSLVLEHILARCKSSVETIWIPRALTYLCLASSLAEKRLSISFGQMHIGSPQSPLCLQVPDSEHHAA